MIGKIKRWLNIEGIKISIETQEFIILKSGEISGFLCLQSMRTQRIDRLQIALREIYHRGRGDSKRIDTYQIGETVFVEPFSLSADEEVRIPFTLHFSRSRSSIERFGDRNLLSGALAKGIHILNATRSEYELEVIAQCPGVAVPPRAVMHLVPK
jgi:hypothetical protein